MIYQTVRMLALTCGVAALLSASATETQACWLTDLFHCHQDRCDPCAQQTTYRPFFSFFRGGSSCCNTCQPQTCNYVPQTCYRTECVNVPVTTCRPVTTCDPCTGCPVTVMRPTTTYVRQVRRVPFTTYRAVAAPAPSCCGAPATSYAPAPGCSTCNAGGAPAPVYSAPAPVYSAPAAPSTPAPYIPESSEAVPQTYEQSATVTPQTFHQETVQPQLPQRQIPDASETETGAPRINTRLHRERGDRWTHSTPARSRWFQPVVARTVAKIQQPVMPANYVAPAKEIQIDDGGWVPAAN